MTKTVSPTPKHAQNVHHRAERQHADHQLHRNRDPQDGNVDKNGDNRRAHLRE